MGGVSQQPAVVDALVVVLTAALPAVRVLDGPGITDDSARAWLFVGDDDPDSTGAPTAVEGSQSWAGLGRRSRDEEFTVWCTCVCWSGDDALKPVRDAAYGIVAQLEATIVADPTLGGIALWCGLGAVRLRQNATDRGVEAHVTVGVDVRTRLSS
ncbi:MAG: hypothetical protein HYR62_01905 [Actinobacteria bacterium]|nr:hypothetical protein [Actinomycetota bacterium]MBI3687237.1 hypothetical protein [Actinomycetota bacterium]